MRPEKPVEGGCQMKRTGFPVLVLSTAVPNLTVEGNWETMALNNRWTWIVSGG
jgi:hypothetical protein